MIIYDTTLNVALRATNITDLLSSVGGVKCVYNSSVLPTSVTTGLETINFYLTTPFNGALEYTDVDYTVNCRSDNEYTSRQIAQAVYTELNRSTYTDCFMIANILSTIKPADETDNYNTPVLVNIKGK